MFSILIPVRDDLANLRRCVESLRGQDLTGCEILIADDGSRSPVTVADLPAMDVPLRVWRLPGRGPAAARNLLAEQAGGEYLFFLDADTEASPHLLAHARYIVATYPGIPSFFGSYDAAPAWPSLVSAYRNLLHHFVHQQSGGRHVSTFWCGCGVIRRRVYLECGGISEVYDTPSIEDLAFGMRLSEHGILTRIVPELQVKHLKRWTFGKWVYTDLFRRGIPWVRLMRARNDWTSQLNFSRSQRVAALAAILVVLALALALWRPELLVVALFALTLFVFLNRAFFRLIGQARGSSVMIGAVPLHLIYALICVASVALSIFYPPLKVEYARRFAKPSPAGIQPAE